MTWLHDLLLAFAPGTLIGAWLGSRLARTATERQWHRDRCLEAYSDVIRAAGNLIRTSNQLYLDNTDPDLHKSVSEIHMELSHAINRASLLSPDHMGALCKMVSDCFGRVSVTAGNIPKLPQDEWTKLTTIKAAGALGLFMAAASNDLRPPGLSDRWSTWRGVMSTHAKSVKSWFQALGRR